jgi:hypothetical protein
MSSSKNKVDLNALKFNQVSIVTLLLLGFVFNLIYLPVIVSIVLIIGSIEPRLALFKQIYRHVFVQLKLVKPNIVEESPAPHNFAQLLGGIVLVVSMLFLFNGSIIAGWAFAWFVILLALANIIFGFCAGCFIYFRFGKLGVPGFHINPKGRD